MDPEINSLLWDITEILSGRRPKLPVHLTIRGPYDGPVPKAILERCRTILKYDVMRIAGVGRFSNPQEEVVFLRVDSPHLRDVWWKPDYRVSQHGFEPHVSLYRGHDRKFADVAAEFLRREKIDLLCAEYQLVSRRPRQLDLFYGVAPRSTRLTRLTNTGRVVPRILGRLRELVAEYQRRHECSITSE